MSQVVPGSVYPQSCRFSKTFLLQQFVQVAILGAENRPVCPSFRLRTKRAKRQTLDTGVRPIPGRYRPKSGYGRGDSGCVEERLLQEVAFSPQLMWSQPGLTRKSKYQT
jgi:hypothetical protein